MKRTGGNAAYDGWNKDIPILLLSGRDDPVGNSGKGVERVRCAMSKAGLKAVAREMRAVFCATGF